MAWRDGLPKGLTSSTTQMKLQTLLSAKLRPWGPRNITPPPKKSCLDRARNTIARVAAQIRIDFWRSAAFLKRIKKWATGNCWYCTIAAGLHRVTRSQVLPHCRNPRIVAAREYTWDNKKAGERESVIGQPPPGTSITEVLGGI